MARFAPASPSSTTAPQPKRLSTATLLEPIISLWVLCTKRASNKSTKKVANSSPPKSSFGAKPRQLLATISNKAMNFRSKNNKKKASAAAAAGGGYYDYEHDDYDFGDGGLWQRSILMGDKCQPLDFSGVIYYDNDGKRLPELPARSPRASPMPNYLYAKKETE